MRILNRCVLVLVLLLCSNLMAQQWTPLGPDGGDVRSLARDPYAADRIVLGTSAGQIYESTDGGAHWARFAKLGDGNDYVLDSIVFHPTREGEVYAAAWSIENSGGDIFHSLDGGRSWKVLKDMHGKSIRAFAMAASNPDVLVAGALDGVFRSKDGGDHWSLISPPNHADIRNVESIAIDPRNPDIIYAGTWHLPWKTSDGGLTWKNIKNGVVDDSDVFSIIIDPRNPSVVFASACSGIYKSESSGDLFHKVQGIPYSARRTRMLRQDPSNSDVVYAGTTEGLWKSTDSGSTWRHITGSNIIVNAILVDPARPSHVLLATDRSGILGSTDGGITFTATNHGFTHRQVGAVVIDHRDPSTFYAGLINDKEFGGVFVSHNRGQSWQQMSTGLGGRDVFTLRQTQTGELVAGTNHGVFALKPSTSGHTAQWMAIDNIINVEETARKVSAKSKSASLKGEAVTGTSRKYLHGELNSRINNLEITPTKWFAAASSGLYASNDQGKSWHGGAINGLVDFVDAHASGDTVIAAARKSVLVSHDLGVNWIQSKLPANVTGISSVTIDDAANLYIGTREGAYKSTDGGDSWNYVFSLPVNNVAALVFDEEELRLMATSSTSTQLFESRDNGKSWQRLDSGWPLRTVRSSGGRVIATTAFDGVVAQPEAKTASASTANGGQR